MRKSLKLVLPLVLAIAVVISGGIALADTVVWSENWDSYPTGQDMHGVGGWKGWDNNPAVTAFTSNGQFLSSPNSIDISGSSDLVHEFSYDEGLWVLTAQQFVPSDFTGVTYFLLMNEYTDGGPYSWASQVEFDGGSNLVVPWYGFVGTPLPLIKGAWVEIRVEIDLDSDWQRFYYNGDLLYQCAWTWFGGGAVSLAAIDLFANAASPVYYDDLAIASAFWSENWDSYPTGQDMHGVGGWKGWDNNPAATEYTSSFQSLSSPNSIEIAGASDLVHEFSYNDGLWVLTAQQFVPSDFTGVTYFLLMNEYTDGGPYSWASQVFFTSYTGWVAEEVTPAMNHLPLIKDQWVEIRVEIDLDADWQRFYYGGDLLYECPWTAMDPSSSTSIAAIDLFANGASPVYYDDLSIAPIIEGTNTITVQAEADGNPLAVPVDWAWDINSSTDTTSFDIADIPDGTELSLTAPATHTEDYVFYVFDHWSVGGTDYDTGDVDITFEVNEDLTAVAHYTPVITVDKTLDRCDSGNISNPFDPNALPLKTSIYFGMTIRVEAWADGIEDIRVEDGFGADLIVTAISGGYNNYKVYPGKGKKGATKCVWELWDMDDGDWASLGISAWTGTNAKGKQEYTSTGEHTLNGGPKVFFSYDGEDFMLQGPPITVNVVK